MAQKLVDLHLHLDGSLSVDIIRKLADVQQILLTESDAELQKKLQVEEIAKTRKLKKKRSSHSESFLKSLSLIQCSTVKKPFPPKEYHYGSQGRCDLI